MSQSLSWPHLLTALRSCSGESVRIRDGNSLEPAGSIRNRPSAKGTELCLFPGEKASPRKALIEELETLSQRSGRQFATSAKARINETALLVDSVADEEIDGKLVAVIRTRRPKLGYNQSQQIGATTTLRSKRIKNG